MRSGDTSAKTAVERQPLITEQRELLEAALGRLHDNITRLDARMSAVMRPAPPEQVREADESTDVEMANFLKEVAGCVATAADRVYSMFERCEL